MFISHCPHSCALNVILFLPPLPPPFHPCTVNKVPIKNSRRLLFYFWWCVRLLLFFFFFILPSVAYYIIIYYCHYIIIMCHKLILPSVRHRMLATSRNPSVSDVSPAATDTQRHISLSIMDEISFLPRLVSFVWVVSERKI